MQDADVLQCEHVCACAVLKEGEDGCECSVCSCVYIHVHVYLWGMSGMNGEHVLVSLNEYEGCVC